MRITLVLLILVICGSLFSNNITTALPTIFNHLPITNNEIYHLPISDKYSDNTDYLDRVLPQNRRQINLHHPKFLQNAITPKKLEEKTTYLVVNRMPRDKRYINYLQLCHFKICNMGRKRSARYFHMIRKLDDNES